MTKIDSNVFLSVRRSRMGGSCRRAQKAVTVSGIVWEPVVSHCVQKKGWGVTEMCAAVRRWARLFPPHHYGSINLGFPIKRDHTADVKYTLCVERLIKYWLQTYMNLPHQIEVPVGGLPLIRSLIWIWVWKAAGAAARYTFPVLLIYLFRCHVVPSNCEVSVQPKKKAHLHIATGASVHGKPHFISLQFMWQPPPPFFSNFDLKCWRPCTVFQVGKQKETCSTYCVSWWAK